MDTTTYIPATDKQIKYLDDLAEVRDISEAMRSDYQARKATLDKKKASELIGTFLKFPKKPKQLPLPLPTPEVNYSELVKKQVPNLYGQLIDALRTIPMSKYAIPVSELMVDLLKDPVHGDLVFLEVKEYKEKVYMKRLFGAPGAFSRVKPNVEDALAFVGIIQQDSYKYTKLFAEHYQCCGKCGAELTDPTSRKLMLGPECRKAFGL
jgi:hypothetical protein